MKNPVLGTLALLLLVAGGLYLGYTFKDRLPDANGGLADGRTVNGAGATDTLRGTLGLALPRAARNVRGFEEVVERTRLLFARFDVPAIDLPALLDQRPEEGLAVPQAADLRDNAVLLGQMRAQRDPRRPWWTFDPSDVVSVADPAKLDPLDSRPVSGLRCAQRMGERTVGMARLKWRVQVCAGDLDPLTTRVFVIFAEEPAGAVRGE